MAIKKKPDVSAKPGTPTPTKAAQSDDQPKQLNGDSGGGAKLISEPNNNNNNNNNTLTCLAASGTSGRPTGEAQAGQVGAVGESAEMHTHDNDQERRREDNDAERCQQRAEPQHQHVIELQPGRRSPGGGDGDATDGCDKKPADATETETAREPARRSPHQEQEHQAATSTEDDDDDDDDEDAQNNGDKFRNNNEAQNVKHSEQQSTDNQGKNSPTTNNQTSKNNKSASGHKLLTEELTLITNHLEEDLNYKHQRQQQQPRRLSFLQSLLLRKWPYLAVAICIMSSLIFGILLSAMTVYLMHDWTDCGVLAVSSSSGPAASSGGSLAHHPMAHERLDYPADTPVELASGGVPALAALEGEISARSFSAGSPDSNSAPAGADTQNRPRFQRLPGSLVPEHYDLFIWPYIAEPFNFTGRVSIRIKCREPTDNITLHALDLDINEKTIELASLGSPAEATNNKTPLISRQRRQLKASPGEQSPKVKRLSQDKQLQYSIIHLDGPLQAGQDYLLSLDFVGLLNDDLAGFYKIKYDRQNSSEPTWIAATQFQATDARRSFPCFDEPLFKATFSIKIKHWKNMTALSNMPIINQEESQDGLWLTDTFAKSHRMSTYLVAFAVTNFESRSDGNISVWTRPGFIHTADYALKIAGKILRHYEDFFGVEYPLPKMDMIALPDFNAGAMENWGLVTYRETAMLYDESNSSTSNRQRVATVVAHELAHQWFGNLVTPKWWDDLWLNEGFASFVEYIGVNHVEPKARMLDQFVVLELQEVLKLDALSSSHQISIPVNNPDEITEIFDHISYSKGASVIRMMVHFLTEDVFKLGVKRYLRALKYNNAEQSDLWAHLTEAQRLTKANSATNATSNQIDLGQVMNSWTLQIGYPLVTLTRSYDGTHRAKLEQVRYEPYKTIMPTSKTANESSAANNTNRWEIPITYTWKSEQNWQPNTRLWLHQNDTSAGVQIAPNDMPKSDDEWVIVNVNQVGYYRVNYDQRNWRLLIDQLEKDYTRINANNRAQILSDIFELAKAGLLDYKFAMSATRYLKNEPDYLPWESAITSFTYINEMLQRTPIYGDWKDYISDLVEPYYARYKDMDWTMSTGGSLKQQLLSATNKNSTTVASVPIASDDFTEHYNQVNAIQVACGIKSHCIDKAKSLFRQWRETNVNKINPALRSIVYCTSIEHGNKDDWNFLWRVYEKEQNPNERARIQRALTCSKEIWILSRYLEWIFDKTKPIRRQDGSHIFREIANNNYGRDIAFNFVRERWPTIKEFYGKSSFSFGGLVRSVASSFNTQIELNQLLTFYETVKADLGPAKRAFQIAIEEVEYNIRWRNKNYKMLEDWLELERSTTNNRTILVH